MTRPSRICALLFATAIVSAALAPSLAAAGDFIIVDNDGVAGAHDPVFAPVPAPWSGSAFQSEFPDLGYLREATVADWPAAAPPERPGIAGFRGAHGTHGGGDPRDAASKFTSSRFKIQVRPGF
jgi:hypothetical protein